MKLNEIVTQKYIVKGLKTDWRRKLRERKWCDTKHIQSEHYHSGEFNGNACRDILESLEDLATKVPDHLMIFVDALRAFDKVRKACFGEDLLDSYIDDIAEFEAAYMKLEINVTSKAHIIFEHVADFCGRNNKGLGFFSEQAG